MKRLGIKMSNEGFWITIGKVMCPENRKPPSVWTMMIILVIALGIVLWLLGAPWQFNLALSSILMLLVITGILLRRKSSKKHLSQPITVSSDPLQKPLSPWGVFWGTLLLIILWLGLETIYGIGEAYPSWSQWPVLVTWAIMLLIAIIGCVCSYKCSIKETKINEEPVKPSTNPAASEKRRKAQKALLPALSLFLIGFSLALLSFILNVPHTALIVMMTAGGLCWGISGAISLKVIMTATKAQRTGIPYQEQLEKNQPQMKILSILIIVVFTLIMLIASLFILSGGD